VPYSPWRATNPLKYKKNYEAAILDLISAYLRILIHSVLTSFLQIARYAPYRLAPTVLPRSVHLVPTAAVEKEQIAAAARARRPSSAVQMRRSPPPRPPRQPPDRTTHPRPEPHANDEEPAVQHRARPQKRPRQRRGSCAWQAMQSAARPASSAGRWRCRPLQADLRTDEHASTMALARANSKPRAPGKDSNAQLLKMDVQGGWSTTAIQQ
jgi:hypothetical protein